MAPSTRTSMSFTAGRAAARECRRHILRRRRVAADDAGDVRAVPVGVAAGRPLPRTPGSRARPRANRARSAERSRVDHRDADSAAVVSGSGEQSEQPAGPLPHRARARHLVGDGHVREDRHVRRDVGESRIVRHRLELGSRHFQGHRPFEFASNNPAQAATKRRHIAVARRLDDEPDAVTPQPCEIAESVGRRCPCGCAGRPVSRHRTAAQSRRGRRGDMTLVNLSVQFLSDNPTQSLWQDVVPIWTGSSGGVSCASKLL